MSKEIYSPEIQTAIADYLRIVDRSHNVNNFGPILFTGEFQKRFGNLNFAGLEQIFRKNNFNTYCLAVPIDDAARSNGVEEEIVAVSSEDSLRISNASRNHEKIEEIFGTMTQLPFAFFLYPGLDVVRLAAEEWRIPYDPLINLANLSNTGVMTAKPGTNFARMIEGTYNRSN